MAVFLSHPLGVNIARNAHVKRANGIHTFVIMSALMHAVARKALKKNNVRKPRK